MQAERVLHDLKQQPSPLTKKLADFCTLNQLFIAAQPVAADQNQQVPFNSTAAAHHWLPATQLKDSSIYK
jgi:hypothetical protein